MINRLKIDVIWWINRICIQWKAKFVNGRVFSSLLYRVTAYSLTTKVRGRALIYFNTQYLCEYCWYRSQTKIKIVFEWFSKIFVLTLEWSFDKPNFILAIVVLSREVWIWLKIWADILAPRIEFAKTPTFQANLIQFSFFDFPDISNNVWPKQ